MCVDRCAKFRDLVKAAIDGIKHRTLGELVDALVLQSRPVKDRVVTAIPIARCNNSFDIGSLFEFVDNAQSGRKYEL